MQTALNHNIIIIKILCILTLLIVKQIDDGTKGPEGVSDVYSAFFGVNYD